MLTRSPVSPSVLFYFMKVLNIEMVKNIEVMLGQTLNHSVWNSVQCHIIL
jgi:hypothetical protein